MRPRWSQPRVPAPFQNRRLLAPVASAIGLALLSLVSFIREFTISVWLCLALAGLALALDAEPKDIAGTVVERSGDRARIEFEPHLEVAPAVGDRLDFKHFVLGVAAASGAGVVVKVEDSTLWVRVDQGNPDLEDEVLIRATGTVSVFQLIGGAVGLIDACDYAGALERVDRVAAVEPGNSWLEANSEAIARLRDLSVLDLDRAVVRARQALAARDLETWDESMAVVISSGCRNEGVMELIRATAELEKQIGREIDQRVAAAVRSGNVRSGSFDSSGLAASLLEVLAAFNAAQAGSGAGQEPRD